MSYKKKCIMNGKRRVKGPGRSERIESVEKGWKNTRRKPRVPEA